MRTFKIIMPIVLAPDVPIGGAAVACAHASLAGYLAWKDDDIVKEWVAGVFYKRVYQSEDRDTWVKIMAMPACLVLTETRFQCRPIVAVFKPMEWHPDNMFVHLQLYSG